MSKRKVFNDSVTPLPAAPGVTNNGLMLNAALPQDCEETMTLLFSLAIPGKAQTQLEKKVARGEVLTPEELQQGYSVDPTAVEALRSWLIAQGFDIKQVSPDGTSVYASASIDKIERSLQVNMLRVTKDGITYTAAQNPPSLPADVGKAVHAIIGLQPFRQANKHIRKYVPLHGNRIVTDGNAPTPSPSVKNSPPYLVSEILKAYGADGLPETGQGQTIAILIDTLPQDTDLQTFWQHNNVSTTLAQIEKINVKAGALPPANGEESLDVEWTSGIAPGANIRVYAAGSLQFVDLDLALDRIVTDLPSQPGMRQLSVSLGLGETYMGGPKGEVAVQHQKFLRLAATGVNVFVSSGDAGSSPDDSGHNPTGPTQVEYESSDPSVVGVGGTSLTLAANGTVADESGWVSSGGGKSIFFPRPPWQKGAGVPPGKQRLVPDVSLAADPNLGAFLILHGKVLQIGGTSWSAPVWAGFCALINEARSKAGKPPLPFLNPLIYPLIGTAAFRDITTGNNGAFHATTGYDMVTGLGVPNVKELIRALT